jgi:predicted RNA binding protein YcfA (HicA-like mRNA interferase family)
MTKLPTSDKVIRILIDNGFYFKSQKGSHQKYSKGNRIVIVPAPSKKIPVGTLRSISRQSGLDLNEFMNL